MASRTSTDRPRRQTRSLLSSIFHKTTRFPRFSVFPRSRYSENIAGKSIAMRVFEVTLAGTKVHNSTRCYLSLRRGVSHQDASRISWLLCFNSLSLFENNCRNHYAYPPPGALGLQPVEIGVRVFTNARLKVPR